MDSQSWTMIFGIVISVTAVAIFVFRPQYAGSNVVEFLGFKATLSTPTLVIFFVGIALFVYGSLNKINPDLIKERNFKIPSIESGTPSGAEAENSIPRTSPPIEKSPPRDQDCLWWVLGQNGACK